MYESEQVLSQPEAPLHVDRQASIEHDRPAPRKRELREGFRHISRSIAGSGMHTRRVPGAEDAGALGKRCEAACRSRGPRLRPLAPVGFRPGLAHQGNRRAQERSNPVARSQNGRIEHAPVQVEMQSSMTREH